MVPNSVPGAELLYDAAPCGLFIADAAGYILHANVTMCRWLQYPREELLSGVRFADLLTGGGRIFHQTHLVPLLRMQGSVGEVKLQLRRRDGSVVPMMLNMTERSPMGEGLLHVAAFLAEDRHLYEKELLQARREAEDLATRLANEQIQVAAAQSRLHLALEAADLFAWEVDPSTGRRRYEDGAARLLGYAGPLALEPEAFLEAIVPEDRDREMEMFLAAINGATDSYRCTYRMVGRDRVERTVLSAGRSFFDSGGRLVNFVGVLQDISGRARPGS